MPAAQEIARVHEVLEAFHASAAAADAERHLGCLAPTVVFLGTDGGERWVGDDYREFATSYFSRGKGWAYLPSSRAVQIAADGRTAWFDEKLENEWFGHCRGSGVLQLYDGDWRIEQYNLTIPIPNELAAEVVASIRSSAQPTVGAD